MAQSDLCWLCSFKRGYFKIHTTLVVRITCLGYNKQEQIQMDQHRKLGHQNSQKSKFIVMQIEWGLGNYW